VTVHCAGCAATAPAVRRTDMTIPIHWSSCGTRTDGTEAVWCEQLSTSESSRHTP
jgi:hypothetical protein